MVNSANPLDLQPHDLGIKFMPPASQTDPRVPMAEELALSSEIFIELWRSSRRQGWKALPKFETNVRRLKIAGSAQLKIYRDNLNLDTSVTIPALENTGSVIKRDDYLSLVSFCAEVGAIQDAALGQISFRYRHPLNQTIETIRKENSRRYRSFWMLVLTSSLPTADTLLSGMTTEANGNRRLAIANTLETGFTLTPGVQVYARDSRLTSGVAYPVIPDSIEFLPLCLIRRLQNYQEDGFTYGYGGEEPLEVGVHVISLAKSLDEGEIMNRVRGRIQDICAGIPGQGSSYKRPILNLVAGQVAGNPGKAGQSASSPNGSVCLSNDQRVTFTNQAFAQQWSVVRVTAGNGGAGSGGRLRGLLAVGLNTNAPSGSVFSEVREDHKIYTADGVEQSSLGTFSNLGGSGSLQWLAGENSPIIPGTVAYFVPSVRYPAGSGFNLSFAKCEKAWRDGVAIAPENIRQGYEGDIDNYQDPFGNEGFIIVVGPERAALHYIYKKVVVTTDGSGVAVIPPNESGCFAFIQGRTGRINSPVCTGLKPNTSYQALIYYPPRSTESWQFQFAYCEYQGIGVNNADWIDGATVVSPALFFIHTQGGGLSVHQGQAATRYSPISFHLPSITNPPVPSYRFDAPIQLVGEPYLGPDTNRELPLMPGFGLAIPTPGQRLGLRKNSGIQARSLNATLLTNNQPVGFRTPTLQSKSPFQAVLYFAAQKGEEVRLVVVTYNSPGTESVNVAANSQAGAAIDLFRL